MRRDDRQAYDRGTSLYSPDGRIYQVEYAREAVARGAPAVAVQTADGVVLAAVTKTPSTLMASETVEKIHKLDDHVGAVTAGHAADCRQLVDYARRLAQQERLRHGERIGVETLVTELADAIQEATQSGGIRPFGAALLVGGVDDNGPRLVTVGPEGSPETWQATVIGRGRTEIQEFLESNYRGDLTTTEAVTLAVNALVEGSDDLDANDVSASVITTDGYESVAEADVAAAFETE